MLPTTSIDSTNTRKIQARLLREPSVSDGLRLANGHSVGSRALQAPLQERLQEKDSREAEPSEEDGGRLGVGLGEPAHASTLDRGESFPNPVIICCNAKRIRPREPDRP